MKFRRKPTTIEAVQFNGENEEEVYASFGADGFTLLGDSDGFQLVFKTAHGDEAIARAGDWITPDAEPLTFYPIKDNVMQTNYEVFSYTDELHEDSTGEEVHRFVVDKLRTVLPESQVIIASSVMADYGMLEGEID